MKLKNNFKRIFSGVMSLVVTASIMPCFPAFADEQTESERYPYTMFAASDSEGAITINADNICINGSIAANGTIVSTSPNFNVNGTKTENANEEMIYIQKKLNYSYFSGDNVEMYADDYSFEDLNININNPMDVYGSLELTGNINLNSGIKALEDVSLNGEVKNTNNSVIFSETGNININTSNTNFSGLIYAPYGDIVIDTDNLNLNNVVIIGQTITLDCPSVNANYSTYVAELVGTESDIDVELYAMGEYNSETNSIDIEWYTNYADSSYEIWISDDNANYTSVGVVTDETTYQYPITEDFEKRYFKISLTTNYGEYIESVPFVVTKTESDYSVDFLDSDGDGLPDVYEITLGTDINNVDSDDDGLTDYQEVYITGTDPTVYDSVTEGVSDADADSDGDGLSNTQEIELGTDPLLSDTDDDGLSDYDEIYVYGTEPLDPDTDGDGLEDGDEPHIGLDPANPETFGIPDAEYKVEQTISVDSDVLADINTVENAYELFIDIKTNGYAEKEVTVSKSSYSYVIENDAMIGLSTNISISDTCNPEEIVLKYDIKEAYIDNTLNLYSGLEEFQGIKRLNVFKFDEDKNMLLPVETEFDVENGLLYAEVDELGTYCIMDMEIWLNNLGVEMPKESQNEENAMYLNLPSIMSASEDSDSVWTPTYINAPIDLVFMIDSDGNYKYEFETEKSLIANICDFAFVCYKDVRVHIISCTCSSSNVLKSSNGKSWFENRNEVQKALNSIQYTNCNSNSEKNDQFNTLINGVEFQDNSDRFIYKFHNHGNSRTSYDRISSLDFCRMKLGIYSEISPVNWYYPDSQYEITLKKEITDNNGLFIEIDSNTLTAIAENIANNLSYVRPVYEIIIPNKWKKIYLDGELSPDNDIDTDKDTLTDWEEVDTARLIWNEDGSFDIPTFNISELICHLVRFQSDDYYFIVHNSTPHCYLPILSDPTSINSDGDALEDSKDIDPLYLDPNPISYSNILSIEYKYIPLQEIDSIAGWIGRGLSKKWDCNVYVSIIKSCICEEDIFCIFTENLELSEAYPITNDLIKELTNAEKEYQNSIYHVKNENAAHAGKLATDQLVPNYFDKNSSYYYGCWYHNYYHELYMSGYYSEKIDMASKAFLVYTAVLGMYQSKILASEQKAIQLSQEEYNIAYKETIIANSDGKYISIAKESNSYIDYVNNAGKTIRVEKQQIESIDNSINNCLSSSNIGTATEAKVAKYMLDQGEVVVQFRSKVGIISNNKVVSTAGDIDVATSDKLIEVKASISSVKPEQIKKYVDSCNEKFFNFEGKNVIIYIDNPIDMSNLYNIEKIEELEKFGVTIVNSLEELREVIK